MPEVVPPVPFLLVTAGGGGDGAEMMDWVLSAYESGAALPWSALLALGPFMAPELKEPLIARARALDQVRTLTFDACFETIMARAAGVVAMGGYNTFCEILSFDRKAIMVPRTRPRREQLIRAQRAESLGLARMLNRDESGDTARMVEALRALPAQLPPSNARLPELLNGHETALARVDHYLNTRPPRRPAAERSTDSDQDNIRAETSSSARAAR
jgi:predicted glycosyltransferase